MIQVIERALDILEFVAQHNKEAVQLSKIAAHAGISQSTCANIIKTLTEKNYLENVSRKTGYRLGANAYRLTGNLSYSQNLLLSAKEPMEELTNQLNETCLLGVLRNNKRYILHLVNCDQDLQVRPHIEADIYPTATGRILMAFLSPKDQENLLQSIGLPQQQVWPGIRSREDLQKALQKIRDNKIVQTLSAKHIIGVAVPLYKEQQVIASLSVFVPESRFTTQHGEKIYKAIRRTSKKITERLEQEVQG